MGAADDHAYEMYLQDQDEARQDTIEDHALLMHADAISLESAVDEVVAKLDRSPEAVTLGDAWLHMRRHLDHILGATNTFGT